LVGGNREGEGTIQHGVGVPLGDPGRYESKRGQKSNAKCRSWVRFRKLVLWRKRHCGRRKKDSTYVHHEKIGQSQSCGKREVRGGTLMAGNRGPHWTNGTGESGSTTPTAPYGTEGPAQ